MPRVRGTGTFVGGELGHRLPEEQAGRSVLEVRQTMTSSWLKGGGEGHGHCVPAVGPESYRVAGAECGGNGDAWAGFP